MNKLNEDFTTYYKMWKKGDKRKEDKFNSNINELKTIDLGSEFPFLFADKDLIVNGNDRFIYDDLYNIITNIEKNGWTLPIGGKEFDKLFYKSTYPHLRKNYLKCKFIPNEYASINSTETNETLYFYTDKKYGDKYWTLDENGELISIYNPMNIKTARGFNIGDKDDNCVVRFNNFDIKDDCKIRLIKYKK